jgi:hypothetical protein
MKLLKCIMITFFCLFCLASHAQKSDKYKITFTNKKVLRFPGPFSRFEKKSYCQLSIDDTTLSVNNFDKRDSNRWNISLSTFCILDKSKDNSKFLLLSSFYYSYQRFSFQNGFVYTYLVEVKNKRLNIYISNAWSYKISNIDSVLNKSLLISARKLH